MLNEGPVVKGKKRWPSQICKRGTLKFTVPNVYKIFLKNAYDYKDMCMCYMEQRNGKGELEWLDP